MKAAKPAKKRRPKQHRSMSVTRTRPTRDRDDPHSASMLDLARPEERYHLAREMSRLVRPAPLSTKAAPKSPDDLNTLVSELRVFDRSVFNYFDQVLAGALPAAAHCCIVQAEIQLFREQMTTQLVGSGELLGELPAGASEQDLLVVLKGQLEVRHRC